jgi:hypothetical protein
MKKFSLLLMLLAVLTVFNGCQKDEPVLVDEKVSDKLDNPMFAELKEIAFSVEDNRLVFETENDFQKCIDFLAQLGDKNFPAFEDAIGFESYRKSFYGTKLWSENLKDELFATLINPDGCIQVGNYYFKVDFENEKTLVMDLFENEYLLKSVKFIKSNSLEFSWGDDVFAILNNEPILKSSSYCSGNQITESYPDFIKATVDFNNYGLYHNLRAKLWNDLNLSTYFLRLKTVDSPYSPPIVPTGITSRCFWINNKEQNIIVRDFIEYNNTEVATRPYSSTRRLKGYRMDVEFFVKINSWDQLKYDRIVIECHKY